MMKAVLMIVLIIHLKRKAIIKSMMMTMMMMKTMTMKKVRNLIVRMKFFKIFLVLKGRTRRIISYNNKPQYKQQKVRGKLPKKVRRMNLQMKTKKVKNQNKVKRRRRKK
jgi:hypothetical protein